MPKAACDRLGSDAAVAGEHHDPHALGAERAQRLGGIFLDWIGHADESRRAPVDRDEHHGVAVAAQFLGARAKLAQLDTVFAEQRGVSGHHDVAVDTGAHALACERAKLDRVGEFEPARLGTRDDRRAERMLA